MILKNNDQFKNRSIFIEDHKNQLFDLIIIGGGITGAGILLDACSRGKKCLLIEKNDYASGTSSKSTKLIHGGLRYLKNLESRWLVMWEKSEILLSKMHHIL